MNQALTVVAFVLAALSWAIAPPARGAPVSACKADPPTLQRWRAVREHPHQGDPDELAPALAECLASPDPELRDGIAFSVLTHWLRHGDVEAVTVARLRRQLQPWLLERGPGWVYGRAFAALVLSELVRYDRQSGDWTRETLAGLLSDALKMLAAEQDFRGLEADTGWIHAVAHASDLLWRLARHPGLDGDQLRSVLDGVAGKVAPAGGHSYVFGEFDRLARVVVVVAERELVPADELNAWLNGFRRPRRLGEWRQAFESPAGMAELHNTRGFLRALREGLRLAEQQHLLPAVDAALAALP